MAKLQVSYDFGAINESSYEMLLNFSIDHSLLAYAFEKSMKAIKETYHYENNKKLDEVKLIPINPNYYNLIAQYLRKHLKIIKQEMSNDNINILSNTISEARFIRASNESWICIVKVGGLYTKLN